MSERLQAATTWAVISLPFLLIGLIVLQFIPIGVDADQERDLKAYNCAAANNLSLAFREPQEGESIEHFEDRMRAQRFTLEQARDLDCEELIPGFDANFDAALDEIRTILEAPEGKRKDLFSSAPDQGRPDRKIQPAPARPSVATDTTPPGATPPPAAAPPSGTQGPQGPAGPRGPEGPGPDDPDSGGGLGDAVDDVTDPVCDRIGVPGVC